MAIGCNNDTHCLQLFKEFVHQREVAEAEKAARALPADTGTTGDAPTGTTGGAPGEKSNVTGVVEKGETSVVREENLHRTSITNSPISMHVIF